MARFDNFEPAPLNQTIIDRGVRSTANGAVGGVKGAFAGVAALWASPFVFAAATASLVAFAWPVVAGAGAVAVGTLIGLGAVATVGSGLAAFFGTGVAALAGGIWGGSKGYSQEYQRAGLDQSMYNAVVAEAVSRGAAQGQALAYIQAPAQGAYIQPQPLAPQAQVLQQPVAPIREEALAAPANDNDKPSMTVAASGAQLDGTLVSAQKSSQLG